MLKIAHIIRRFTFAEWGGTETVVWNTVQAQRAKGHEAVILATSALSRPGEEVVDGVPIRRFPYVYPYFPLSRESRLILDKKGGNPYCRGLFRALREGGFDVVHVHNLGRLAQVAVREAGKLGIPCLLSLHGGMFDVPKTEVQKMVEPLKRTFPYGGIIDRLLGIRFDPVAKMDAVICIGRHEEQLLKEHYPRQTIFYLPNGINTERFRQAKTTSPRVEWGIPADRKVILCISRIDYQKNQKMLVELLARTAGTHLVLIGPVTSEWYRQELEALVDERGVRDRFTLIPGLPPTDPRLVDVLREADVFVVPSVHEPFGIVALEAQAGGIPLISSDAGGLKDFIRDGENGLLFPSGDVEALCAAYNRLTTTPGLPQALVAQALEDVQGFTWSALVDRLLGLYEELRSAKGR